MELIENSVVTAISQDLSTFSKEKRLSCLELLLQSNEIDSNVVQNLLLIENVTATITDYREKEKHLESLLKLLRQQDLSQSEATHTIVLRHLLGSLYINFEKFWGPTIRVILDILNQTKFQSKLLSLIVDHLRQTNDLIYNDSGSNILRAAVDRPDPVLHRNFLFQILSRFVNIIETDSVPFMEQFFRFVEEEMLKSPFIEKFSRDNLIAGNEAKLDIDLDMNEAQISSKERLSNRRKSKAKLTPASLLKKRKSRETFITASKIIQAFSDINAIHRHAELKGFLLDLLCCRDGSVQKASFSCILAHDHEYLAQYANRFLKIINDKMVRTELTMFSVDEETDQIQKVHRPIIMPILLRLLFGKMIGKLGHKSSGRDKAASRKDLVMRFVAGCNIGEIDYFFQHLFDPIFEFVHTPYNYLEPTLRKNCDLSKYVPLNKLHAMLISLTSYIESVGHGKTDSLPNVLKLINIIAFYTITPLEDQSYINQLSARSIERLKAIRRLCINITTLFFDNFEYYDYKQDEINFIFEHIIWPSTKGFVDRNYAQSTPLLKLIESLARHRAYHSLLIKRNKDNRDQYLLHHIVDLYSSSKTLRPMLKRISSMLANIINPDRKLAGQDDEDLDNSGLITTFNDEDAMIPTYNRNLYKVIDNLKLGEEMLMSSIPLIFVRLNQSCQDFIDKRDVTYQIENDELFVLSSFSKMINDPEMSLLGARLLLTTLLYQRKGNLLLNTHTLLDTVHTLLEQIEKNTDTAIIPMISEILSYQRNTEQRQDLCNLIKLLACKDSNLVEVSSCMELMNSTSDEYTPNLFNWNEGFKRAFEFIDNLNEFTINQRDKSLDSIMLLLHQTGFIISNVDQYEFSIRDNCSLFYEKLAKKLNLIDEKNSQLINQLIEEVILNNFIRKGLRETNETVKNAIIGIIRSLALYCHEKSKVLQEFFMFCSDNLETDFWINIRHIQLHNRSKALARLIANENIHQVSPKTLSAYFLPLASSFLFSKSYKSLSSLTENSIKLIGIICKHLNWMTYESTLSYYLDLLTKANATYQKTNIKLITEILKNFNYDITACKEAMETSEENAKLEKRMRKRRGAIDDGDDNSTVIHTDAPSGKKLNPSTARLVYASVTKKLLPRLNSCLHEMTRVEFEHDKNMSDYLPEKDEIKRIPIAYAIVQLLNLLPGRYVLFRDNLPTIFLKLSSFLKSKNEQVRKTARSILIKIMRFVGPAYMPDLLRVLQQNLAKGFQIHVLIYTVHSVLESLPLNYGDLDHSVQDLVNLSFREIFGKLAEDKEIAQILAKTFEAKKTKSYDTIMILCSSISAEKLDYIMSSVKEVLKTSNEPKKVNKLSICVQRIFTGLSKNENFPLDKMFVFIQSTIEESIPSLKVRQQVDQAEKPMGGENSRFTIREDRYLIARDLPRDRIKSKINEKGNLHMLIENSLRLLLHTLDKNKLVIKRKESLKKKLDGFINLLSTCLKSSSPKCVMRSLKCIYFIAQAKTDLPTFKLKCSSIMKKIFVLLNLFNGVGMVQGDNLEMIGMCFKTITLLLLRCEYVQLTNNQIRALLTYIEQDLHDTTRQVTALGALNSLLRRKLSSPELYDIMIKISDLLVTSESESVRSLSGKMWQIYLLEYKHERGMLQSHLTKFLRQLDYEYIDGRKSVIKMLAIIVKKFPEKLLLENFELMFNLLSQRLVNEESKEVRDLVAQLVSLLIQRLPEQQNYLFNKFVLQWASDKQQTGLNLLGVKLISIFVESSKTIFSNDVTKLKKILLVIVQALERGIEFNKFQTRRSALNLNGTTENQEPTTEKEGSLLKVDHRLIYASLRLFQRLLKKDLVSCIENRYIESLKKIWHDISSFTLSHWSLPIVLTSCELYLFFIKKHDFVTALDVEEPTSDNYLEWNAKTIVRTLCDKYIKLLDRGKESNQLLNYLTQGLILLGQLVANSKATIKFEQEYLQSLRDSNVLNHLLSLKDLPANGFIDENVSSHSKEAKKQLNLMWLSTKVVMQARKEAALYRLSENYRREFVLKWSAAISQELGTRRIAPYTVLFLMTPVRELTDKGKTQVSSCQNIAPMAEDLLKFLKSLVGVDMFNKIYSKVQLHYTKKRVDRKKRAAIEKVKDQARGVKRKLDERKVKNIKKRKGIRQTTKM